MYKFPYYVPCSDANVLRCPIGLFFLIWMWERSFENGELTGWAGNHDLQAMSGMSKTFVQIVFIFPYLASKIYTKSDRAVQLWCLQMWTAIGQVKNSPCYYTGELVVGIWSKFHLLRPSRSVISIPICFCKIFCAPSYYRSLLSSQVTPLRTMLSIFHAVFFLPLM